MSTTDSTAQDPVLALAAADAAGDPPVVSADPACDMRTVRRLLLEGFRTVNPTVLVGAANRDPPRFTVRDAR